MEWNVLMNYEPFALVNIWLSMYCNVFTFALLGIKCIFIVIVIVIVIHIKLQLHWDAWTQLLILNIIVWNYES